MAPRAPRMQAAAPVSAAAPSGPAAVLESWRLRGRDLVAQHHAEFEALLDPVETAIAQRRFATAAAAAQLAATHAVFWHPGAFVSHRLERALRRIGEAALPVPGPPAVRPGAERPLRVLHVASRIGAIGGHGRNMQRWIAADRGAVHSVAMTRQTEPLPDDLRAAVVASGGTVSCANRAIGGPLDWAGALQPRLAEADLVVLHVHNQDVVPFLALAGMRRRPHVALLNHADHVFWLGSDFVDAVISSRRSGHALCAARRDIPDMRSLTLPLCLEPVTRRMDRNQAKRALGLDPGDLVMLSVARAVKFRPIGGQSFADALLPVLLENPRVRLVAVGPGGTADWRAAESRAPGQIIALPENPDTKIYFEAADIYLDSFPFPSNTSLLEAGLHGLPLVSRRPFGEGCDIMAADSIGMDDHLQQPRSLDDFHRVVRRLVTDDRWRQHLGRATRETIEATNLGSGFRDALDRLYGQILELPQRPACLKPDTGPRFDQVDLFSPFVFGRADDPSGPHTADQRLALAVEISLKTMPPWPRIGTWLWLARHHRFHFRSGTAALRYLVPEWLTARVRLGHAGACE